MSHYISFVHIPALAIRSYIRPLPKLGLLDTDRLKMRVWPSGIDFNFHLNNARYLSVMDYGRMHLLARTHVLTTVLRARWTPIVGAVWITYRRSLPLFARFTLETRLVCWDERWFYMEQTFTSDEGLVAVGWVKGALQERGGAIVAPQRALDRVSPGIVSPSLPEAIQTWNELTKGKLRAGS